MNEVEGRRPERVLLVDDEPQVLIALEDLLADDFTVLKAGSGEHALKLVEDNRDDLAVIITDQRMPKMSGDEFLSQLDGRSNATRMMVTGFADLAAVIRAVNEGRIFAYVAKPWQADDFKGKVQRAAEHFRLTQELAYERQLLRDLMDNMPDGIYFKDTGLRFLRANRPLLERWNSSHERLVGKRLSELLETDGQARAEELEEERLLSDGVPILDATRKHVFHGAELWFSESKAPVRNPSGEIVGIVGIARDVTQRKQQEARIARLTSVHTLMSGINAAIVRAQDRDALLAEACRIAVAASELALAVVARVDLASGAVRIVAKEPLDAPVVDQVVAAVDPDRPSPALVALFESRRPIIIDDIAQAQNLRYRDTMLAHGLASAIVIPLFCANEIDSVFCLFSSQKGFFDGEEVKLLTDLSGNISFALDHLGQAERLDFLAYHDDLTGLPNRELFLDRTQQQVAISQRDGRSLAVAIIDVERFRHVNETLGRQGGDALLQQVAARLKAATASVGTLARLFGNTFAILISPVDSEAFVGLLVENEIQEALRAAFVINDTEILASARVGIALFPSDGEAGETLLANAEAALKKAKASGQPYVFYAPVMNARVSEQLALETKLRRAIERDEFLLHYQPKVDLKRETVVGLEALIRWRDPQTGLVPPGKFIPLLEETGLIREVGRWVLERAAAQHHEWRQAGLSPPRIAVNVSGLQLAARDFVERLERVLNQYPFGTSGIDLEITESVFVDDLDGSIEKLEAARRHGLKVAMDDFGTGYSSLSSLGRLPLDSLKIDRSFVSRMTDEPQSTSIVTTIISLGHALDLSVIAEGVETFEQARLLRLLKCNQAQGYLFAKPMPAHEVVKMLGGQFNLSAPPKA